MYSSTLDERQRAFDLLMWVGEQFYPTPEDFASEAVEMGVSKRIPINNPPQGMVKGVSRIFFIHPKAGLKTHPGTVEDLGVAINARLAEFETVDPPLERAMQDWSRNPSWAYRQIMALSLSRIDELAQEGRAGNDELCRQYRLVANMLDAAHAELYPGIFGFVYVQDMEYVLKDDEQDVPEHLRELGVVPVRVIPVKDAGKGENDAGS